MPTWDPQHYLAYADERARPFADLLTRVPNDPRTVVDLGCGPGHLSALLRARWPDAMVHGIDSSEQMIATAIETDTTTGATYEVADLATWTPSEPADLLVSNAALQWVPTQLEAILRLRDHVAPGGTLAFQVPFNFHRPSHVLLGEIASRPAYAQHTGGLGDVSARGVAPERYLDLLVGPGWHLDVWQTTYLHVLPGEDPVFDWISGTGARPILQALPDDLREQFAAEYKSALREAYPRRSYGTVLPFDRVFVVAARR